MALARLGTGYCKTRVTLSFCEQCSIHTLPMSTEIGRVEPKQHRTSTSAVHGMQRATDGATKSGHHHHLYAFSGWETVWPPWQA